MFQKSFSYLNKTNLISSLNRSTKFIKTNSINRSNCELIKLFSKSSTNFNLTDKNDHIYELDLANYGHNLKKEETNKQLSNNNKQLTLHQDDDYHVDLDPNSKRIEIDYIRTIQPQLPATFNLATYADHLDIIKHLVKLNVKLYEIERDRELTKFLLTLNFEKDVVPYLNFLIRCGLHKQDLGPFLTKNFKILQENLVNLDKRIAYYKKMKFTKKEILKMMLDYPELINYPINIVDAKLGYFQRDLKIKPIFVRKMLYSCPKILKTNKTHLEVM